MAIKPFNSVGGFSVGPNLTPFLNANNDANVANLTVNGSFDLPSGTVTVDNLVVNGDTQVETLSANGAVVFDTTANVGGVLTVTGNANVASNLNVTTNAIIGGFANVTGVLTVAANIDGGANLNLTGSADITGQLIVDGAATLNGATTIDNTLLVTGAANIDNTLRVGGTLTAVGDATVGGTFGVTGATTLSGATTVDNTLDVTGAAQFDSSVTVDGAAQFNAAVTVTNTTVTLADSSLTSNGTVSFSGSNVSLGDVANLSIAGGSNGQYLQTNGSGDLVWATVDTDTLANGGSNVDIASANADVTISVNNVSNVAVFTTTGLNVTSNVTATDTITAATLVANLGANLASLEVVNNSDLQGELLVGGATEIANTLLVTSNITGQGWLDIGANASITQGLTVGGDAVITGNANITGAINGTTMDLSGAAVIDGNIDGGTNLNLTGTANIVTDLLVGGRANVTGGANIGGAVELGSTLDVTGIATFNNDVTVAAGTTLTFDAATGASLGLTTGLTTVALTATGAVDLGDIADITIAGGNAGEVLVTDGSGVLSWSASPNVTQIINGTSNVKIASADGNVTVGVNGQANIITVQSNGTAALTTIVNDVVITGNLIVDGSTTEVNTTELNVEDPIITEGRGANNAPLTGNDNKDRGLYSWYYDGGEKGGFIGYKNTGSFAGKYIIADQATLSNNEITSVASYADVVVSSIVSGSDSSGNTAVTLNAANVVVGTGSTLDVLTVTESTITSKADVVVNGDIDTVGGNITVTGGTAGAFNSQIELTASNGTDPVTATTIGTGAVRTASVTPTPIVVLDDAPGRVVEFFIASRDLTNGNYEGTKYLVVSNGLTGGASVVESTAYGTVRVGAQAQQVEVTFVADGTDLIARVAVLNNTDMTQFTTQYQIIA